MIKTVSHYCFDSIAQGAGFMPAPWSLKNRNTSEITFGVYKRKSI